MPWTPPAGMIAAINKEAGGFGLVSLLDVKTVDGTQYFWCDNGNQVLGAGVPFLSVLTGAQQNYRAWLKSTGPITTTRDSTTDAGDIVVQNLSGNTIDRDVWAALKNHEFEGAFAILRWWLPLFADACVEFHGTLSEQKSPEDEASFRLVQLTDAAEYTVADEVVIETCSWRYKSPQCGSTGSAATCNKRFIDCSDATRAAVERFNGVLSPPPSSALVNQPNTVTYGGGGGDGGPDRGDGGTGIGKELDIH